MTLAGFRSVSDHLDAELARADLLLRAVVAQHAAAAAPDADPRRWGLSEVTPGEIAAFLAGLPPAGRAAAGHKAAAEFRSRADRQRQEIDARIAASRPDLRPPLSGIVRRAGIGAAGRDALLLLALAERDETCRRVVSYLHDNGARPWFSPSLLAQALLLGPHPVLLAPGGPLVAAGLARLDGDGQTLRLADGVASHLAGTPAPAPDLAGLCLDPATLGADDACLDLDLAERLAGLLADEGLAVLAGPDGSLRAAHAARAVSALDRPGLWLSGPRLAGCPDAPARLRVAIREALLSGHVLAVIAADALLDLPAAAAELDAYPGPCLLTLERAERLGGRAAAVASLPPPSAATTALMWRGILAAAGLDPDTAAPLASAFPVAPSRARAAVRRAQRTARLAGSDPATARDVARACRSGAGVGHAGSAIARFGQCIAPRPSARFDDLVLPPLQTRQIGEIRHRLRTGRALFEAAGFERHAHRGRGFTALFSGASGTGKTLAAELMATEQGIDLHKVNLGQLVSKWVGETEKHISRIFAEARAIGCVLFFDECDALFGKRGEVKEARDRWANLEVNHLLVELEAHDGVTILATNLRSNLDDAFMRRINAAVDFPAPDAACRLRIWQRAFPDGVVPPEPDDLQRLAEALDLTGGLIRNVAMDAVARAHLWNKRDAHGRVRVPLRAVVIAAGREFGKYDRPLSRGRLPEAWCAWLDADAASDRDDAP